MRYNGMALAVSAGVLALGLAHQPAQAQQSACADVDFSTEITNRFPNVRNACQGIETRDGRLFAHFEAVIQGTSGNSVRTRFRRADGELSPEYSIEMPADARVSIGGREYRYRDLDRGQEIDIYMPGDLWEFHVPDTDNFAAATTPVSVVTPTAAALQQSAGQLPRTASFLPLLGGLGALLTTLGLGLAAVRRRFR